MTLKLDGEPRSEVIVKIGRGHVLVVHDRAGHLRLMREAKDGRHPGPRPGKDESVFRVTDFQEGAATFKSGASHGGYFSANGCVFWSAIWDDVEPTLVKKCGFQDWVIECARILAGVKKE